MRLGMTRFAAMNLEEFKSTFTTDMTASRNNLMESRESENINFPASVDWVSAGAVTPV
jgi:hypothetical protein